MEKCASLFSGMELPEGLLLLSLVFIAILLIKINGNIKDLIERLSLGTTTRHHGREN